MHVYLNYSNSSILSFKVLRGILTKEIPFQALELHIGEVTENNFVLEEATLSCHSKSIVKDG